MKKPPPLVTKLFAVLFLGVLLTIPVLMISGLVGERQGLRNGVIQDLRRQSIDAQRLIGPVLVIPYKRSWEDVTQETKDGVLTERKIQRSDTGQLHFLPETVDFTFDVTPVPRRRGLYEALTYRAETKVRGSFGLPAALGIKGNLAEYEWGAAQFSVGIKDSRGIAGAPRLAWDGRAYDFEPGSIAPPLARGITATLKEAAALTLAGRKIDFAFTLDLAGLEQLDFVPTGRASGVNVQSTWPHPSFFGAHLPKRDIGADGFSAEWQVSDLATNLSNIYGRCLAGNHQCAEVELMAYGLRLIQPVDIYQQTERAVKYPFLFIGMTFAAFFFYEMLAGLRVHPVQYGLVGLSLAMFFLLLLSLAEQISFPLAYLVAGSACVGLNGFYLSHALKSARRGLLFGSGLAAVYGTLFVILQLEDVALLVGSALLFAALAAAMIATRRIDWYAATPTTENT